MSPGVGAVWSSYSFLLSHVTTRCPSFRSHLAGTNPGLHARIPSWDHSGTLGHTGVGGHSTWRGPKDSMVFEPSVHTTWMTPMQHKVSTSETTAITGVLSTSFRHCVATSPRGSLLSDGTEPSPLRYSRGLLGLATDNDRITLLVDDILGDADGLDVGLAPRLERVRP